MYGVLTGKVTLARPHTEGFLYLVIEVICQLYGKLWRFSQYVLQILCTLVYNLWTKLTFICLRIVVFVLNWWRRNVGYKHISITRLLSGRRYVQTQTIWMCSTHTPLN